MKQTMQRGKSPLIDALAFIAWGYVFLYLDFRLNFGLPLNLLPDWAAYLLFCLALPELGKAVPTALLLRPLGVFLGVWELVSPLVEGDMGGLFTVAGLVSLVLDLYFHFQLLSDLAALAGQHGLPHQQRLLRLRSFRTVFITLLSLPPVLRWMERQGDLAATVVLAAFLFIVLWTWLLLFSLKKALAACAPIPDPLDPATHDPASPLIE